MIHTIWKYAVYFYTKGTNDAHFANGINNELVLYRGPVGSIPRKVAVQVAEIHPNFKHYYENALAPLYKGYRWLRGGTEDPCLAIKSRCAKSEEEATHIIIWKVMEE